MFQGFWRAGVVAHEVAAAGQLRQKHRRKLEVIAKQT